LPELFCAAGVEFAQHELVQHRGLEQRLFVAKSFPDEDEGHDGLAARVEPEGVEGVQRLLGGLMERQVSTTAIAGTVFSLAFSALCVILATPLLQLMQVPADILPIAVSYLRIVFAGLIFTLPPPCVHWATARVPCIS
jgi:hypothetical protein